MCPADNPPAEFMKVFERLFANYSEPHRHYHTADHLFACFRLLDDFFPEASLDVQLALWFHDVVYDTYANDNEEKSGEVALEELGVLGFDPGKVYDLILATKHDAVPKTEDAKILVDVDLSILGEEPDVYDRYERNVRQEYHWVPDEVFWAHRRTVLKGFMKREWIYSTPEFRRSDYEERAWQNLARSVGA